MKKKISLLVVLVLLCLATPQAPVNAHHVEDSPFVDIHSDDPYFDAMRQLYYDGIVGGRPGRVLAGDEELLRSELVTIVVRAKKIIILDSDKNCFPDVQDEWFAGAVCAMVRLGHINGYPDGLFRPGRVVTAGEAAKIIGNAMFVANFSDLQEALEYFENNNLTMMQLSNEDVIIRKEAFMRLWLALKNPIMMDQMDSEGNPFNPLADTIMDVQPDGQPFYAEYHPDQLERHLGKDPVILFFHANWCPLCRRSNAILNESLSELQGGVVILKVDYDTEIELRKEYGITYQDTFVLIDASGVVRGVESGIASKEEAQEFLNKARGTDS